MRNENLGNALYQLVSAARTELFNQGELAQLTYGAFDVAATSMQSSTQEEIEVTYPVGLRPDKQAIQSSRKYRKDELLRRYQYLAFHQLAINGIYQLVTIIEALLGDVVRAVVLRYPQKLGAKRALPVQAVLESNSIEEIHIRATDALLNDLSYKSPSEFAESLETMLSLNLLESPAFHRYIEIKATRDIFIHNKGIANEIYARKAGSHVRVNPGMNLPVDILYFLESYEYCIQLTEWLERQLHEHWHSSEFEDQKQMQIPLQKDNAGPA